MSDPGVNESPAANGGQGDGLPPESQMMSPGARLAAYRKERGWTVEQVASQLNLAPRQIVAIESDDYPALPGMPIVRGFVRAYAKLLKIDPAPLLAQLGGETVLVNESITPRKSLSTPFSESRLPSMTERPSLSSKWVVGLLLVILIGVAIWAMGLVGDFGIGSKPAAVQTKDATPPVPSASEVQQKPAVPAPMDQPAQNSTPAANPTPEPGPAASNATANPVPAPDIAGKAASETLAPVPAGTPATSSDKDKLVLKVRDDSWIEVKRAGNNSVLLSRIVKAGETEEVDVSEPVSVVIGNASGVDASLRGTPLTLKAGRGNVARLILK